MMSDEAKKKERIDVLPGGKGYNDRGRTHSYNLTAGAEWGYHRSDQ